MPRRVTEKKVRHAGNVVAEQIAKAKPPPDKRTPVEKHLERAEKNAAKAVVTPEVRAEMKAASKTDG